MAYKEFTYYAKRFLGHQGMLRYEWATNYAEARDAEEDNTGYNPGTLVGTAIGQYDTYDQPYWDHDYFIYRGSLLFVLNNYSIGAPIEYAAILLKRYAQVTIVIDFDVILQNGMPDYPQEPVVISDYDRSKYEGNGGSIKASDLVIGSYTPLELNEAGRGWIMAAGEKPKFILRSSRDIAGIAPVQASDEERVSYYTNNGSSYDPRLVVRVTLSIPTLSTQEATNLLKDRATLYGTLEDRGWWINSVGFEWKKGIDGEVTYTMVSTSQTVTTYSKTITGLSYGKYYFRTRGENDAGIGYGEWKSFAIAPVKTISAEKVRPFVRTLLRGEIVS